MKQLVKIKTPAGYRTFGSISQGKYGPQLGMKVTKELRDLVNGAQPDSWLNFAIFDETPREQPRSEPAKPLDDEVPW